MTAIFETDDVMRICFWQKVFLFKILSYMKTPDKKIAGCFYGSVFIKGVARGLIVIQIVEKGSLL